MTKTRWVLAVAVLAAACIADAQAPDLERMDLVMKSIPDGPVARVGKTMIDGETFRQLYVTELRQFSQLNPGTPVSDEVRVFISFNALRLLLQREILLQAAIAGNLSVSQAELDEAWASELERLQRALQADDGTLPSEAEVFDRAGTTREETMEELRKALLVEKIRDRIVGESGVTVTETEIAEWYEKNKDKARRPDMCHLQQIFIQLPRGRNYTPAKHEEARRHAEEALKRVQSGESFESVVKAVSEHPESIRQKGGDIGLGPAESLPEPLREAVHTMKPGEISGVIETTAGFYIMKLIEFTPGQNLTLDDSTERIRQILTVQKSAEAVRAFCAQRESEIQVYLDLDKQIATRPDLVEFFTREIARRPADDLALKASEAP